MGYAEQMTYLMLNYRNGYIKIGIARNPVFREKTLHSEEPEIVLLATRMGGRELESALHRFFGHKRVRGEWFALSKGDYTTLLGSGFDPVIENQIYMHHIGLPVEEMRNRVLERDEKIKSAKGGLETCLTDEMLLAIGLD